MCMVEGGVGGWSRGLMRVQLQSLHHQVGASRWRVGAALSSGSPVCAMPAHPPPSTPPTAAVLQDTDVYCRDTLCDPTLVAFLNQTFLCWGGDLQRSDAFRCACVAGDG